MCRRCYSRERQGEVEGKPALEGKQPSAVTHVFPWLREPCCRPLSSSLFVLEVV